MRLQSDIGYEKSTVRRDYEITDVRVTDLLKNRELVESFLYVSYKFHEFDILNFLY